MIIDTHIVNAFTDSGSGGNPAGVVLNANGLTYERKLEIAKRIGVSETAFISDSEIATHKLEFFTPLRRIPHCGHATVAAFSLMNQYGIVSNGIFTKETIDGIRKIVVDDNYAVFMEQRAPEYEEIFTDSEDGRRALSSLNISSESLIDGLSPVIVNTGNSFLLIPLKSEKDVVNLKPDMKAIAGLSQKFNLVGYYAFSRAAQLQGRDAGARMFAPLFGIEEESATGMAAGALASFLRDFMGENKNQFLIEQGRLMQPSSPSVITADLDIGSGGISGLFVGGSAKLVNKFQLEI